ncbi:MAG: RNA polymerase sigma factor [Actinomycetota bacterium]
MSPEAILSTTHHRSVEDAFTAMAPRLWRALLLYTGNHEVADEAVSEAFAQAVGAATPIRDVPAWVWTAAFRIAAGEMRRRTEHAGEVPLDLPAPEAADASSIIDLVHALDHVSDLQRRALILRYYMGYSNVEIARIVGSSPSSIGVQLFRSTRKLRRLLSEET